MKNMEIFEANLVKVEELKRTANGKAYIRFSVARNYSKPVKKENGTTEWVENGTFYSNLVLFDRQAENFARQQINPGAKVIVVGYKASRQQNEFTTKDGVHVPAQMVEDIIVEHIALALTTTYTVQSSGFVKSGNSSSTNTQPQQNTPQPQSAPQPEVGGEFDIFGGATATEDTSSDFDIFK